MGRINFTQQMEGDEGQNETLDVGCLTELDFKFRVHFRRPEDYAGNYGFDWLQDEFQTCVTWNKLKEEYNPCKILNQEYLIPWMSIKNGQQVQINLAIEEFDGVASDIDVIKLKAQKGISFEPEEIKIVDIINNPINHFPSGTDKGTEITVKCTDDIKQDTEIEVYDKNDEVIGKLSFLKNDKEYKLPVRVVLLVRKGFELNDELDIENHLINNVDSDFNGLSDLSACLQSLENEMNYYAYNQAFVRSEFEKTIHRVAIDENEWKNDGRINTIGEIENYPNLLVDLLNIYKNQIERGSNGTGFFKGVVVFVTNFSSGNVAGRGNLRIIDDRNCILFRSGSTYVAGGNIRKKIYVHEIGHVLSLTHPFEVLKKETIQQNEKFVVQINDYLNNPGVSPADKNVVWSEHKDSYRTVSRNSYLYYRNKYYFKGTGTEDVPEKGSTKCLFMDYTNNRKVFTQWQWRTIQESAQKYFMPNKK